jgi:hypothetical protein
MIGSYLNIFENQMKQKKHLNKDNISQNLLLDEY